MNKKEAEQFYIATQVRVDEANDLLKICMFMLWFIHKNKLWRKFSEYVKQETVKWK